MTQAEALLQASELLLRRCLEHGLLRAEAEELVTQISAYRRATEPTAIIHITPTPVPGCVHVWPTKPNGEIDVETACCKACSLPFKRFIFTEMP